ncbi:unnamed protein product [Protopolystoma xenopodis]|uniref:Uncharacterized protein n=1 Tax=Protopolystoma xenopodis TaxID=117903 RepID=A0A448WPA7_9PLAT|nr:unnamed protein product [Protopolystoma xenopodis]
MLYPLMLCVHFISRQPTGRQLHSDSKLFNHPHRLGRSTLALLPPPSPPPPLISPQMTFTRFFEPSFDNLSNPAQMLWPGNGDADLLGLTNLGPGWIQAMNEVPINRREAINLLG